MSDKSTGWRVPLYFCAAILGIVAIVYHITGSARQKPELPPQLERQASALSIDLGGKTGAIWRDKIIQAAGGLADADTKDQRLASVFRDALAARRFDAACKAVVLVKDNALRADLLEEMLEKSCDNCEDLVWGVFAAHATPTNREARHMARVLSTRWRECVNKGTPMAGGKAGSGSDK